MKRRVIDLILFPFLVGLILLLGQNIVESTRQSKKELIFKVLEPQIYLENNSIGDIKIYVDTIRIQSLYSYSVSLKNSGNIPIKDQGVKYVFETNNKDFKILNKTIQTTPVEEFGRITLDSTNGNSARYIYSLINPKDEILTTFLTNEEANVKVYAKSDDLSFKEIKQSKSSKLRNVLIAVIGALIGLIIQLLSDRFIRKYRNVVSPSYPSKQKDDLGLVFNGNWKLTYVRDDKKGSERVRITDEGKYFANDNHRFNLHGRIIDLKNKKIVFNKVLLTGSVHAVEDLTITNNNLIEGKDSLGYELKYEKVL